MKTILGFLAAKLGFSCSGSSSRRFIDGYMLGAGITVKNVHFSSKRFGKKKYGIAFWIQTRKDFAFGFRDEILCDLKYRSFCFGFGIITISREL